MIVRIRAALGVLSYMVDRTWRGLTKQVCRVGAYTMLIALIRSGICLLSHPQ